MGQGALRDCMYAWWGGKGGIRFRLRYGMEGNGPESTDRPPDRPINRTLLSTLTRAVRDVVGGTAPPPPPAEGAWKPASSWQQSSMLVGLVFFGGCALYIRASRGGRNRLAAPPLPHPCGLAGWLAGGCSPSAGWLGDVAGLLVTSGGRAGSLLSSSSFVPV